jgi:hypothetical protein
MKFYHGTDKEGHEFTQKQGYLLYPRATKEFPNISPCVYLAVDLEEAQQYGDHIYEVEYNPTINPAKNNYNSESWQVRVYEPIPLNQVKLIQP